jgi:hypothetical protein
MSDSGRSGCIGAFFGIVFGGVAGLLIGGVAADRNLYHKRYLEERSAFAPLIESDSAFKAVAINERSDGGIWVSGSVPTDADKKRRQELLTRSIGTSHGSATLEDVTVRPKP